MKIFGKILILLLVLAIVPLTMSTYFNTNNIQNIGNKAIKDSRSMGKTISEDSEKALVALGEKQIEIQAELTADRISTYILDHPEMTSDEFMADPNFQEIAQQRVGETGYITVSKYDEERGSFFISHPVPQLIGVDYYSIANNFPDLKAVTDEVEKTHEGAGGYYKWKEDWNNADEVARDKYLWVTSRDSVLTADGWQMTVSATTYIEEFSKPVVDMKQKIEYATNQTTHEIDGYIANIVKVSLIAVIVIALLIIFAGLLAAKGLSNPIVKLKKAADEVTQGNFDIELPMTHGRDEIAELTASMEMMIAAIKNKN